MTIYFAQGSPTTDLSDADLREALRATFDQLAPRERVLAIPPDFTRFYSRAGDLTSMTYEYFGQRLTDVMPALGTHFAMPPEQLDRMFPGLPHELIRVHKWREDVVTIGEVPAEFVSRATDGIWQQAWPAQLNKLVWEGEHDLILSIGQVVPHEVIGMANYNKNIFVGTGGVRGINESHFIGAAYGMERMMGRADTPLRRLLNYAQDNFCQHLPLLYILTVIGENEAGKLCVRGLYIGDDVDCYEQACTLSLEVNFKMVEEPLQKVVCYMDPDEYHSTWIGNKALYRTRMAIADGGELVILAPGVKTFGEDPQIDVLIRKYGYRTTEEVMRFVEENEDLAGNLSAAAHLIHGSSENRFTVRWCPGHLTREEIEGAGYEYGDLEEMLPKYDPFKLKDGWNDVDGEQVYFISKPALGLWAHRGRFDG
jgi:nickel-dependent lactate racemase